jgi:glycosyltransferase involved in cell wall biosynthesis
VFLSKKVAVVLPAHNEAGFIGAAIRSLPSFVDAIFVVDDASDDATMDVAVDVAACDPRVRVLRHAANRGVGAAIVTGYRAALESRADIVAVMDGDGQMHPHDLANLVESVAENRADLAKGNRFDGLRPRGTMPPTRLVGNVVLSFATKLAGNIRIPLDAQCGYTAVATAALRNLPLDDLYPRYGFPNDLVLRSVEARLRIVSVPVRSIYGDEVSGIRPFVAVPRILALLLRAFGRRLRGRIRGGLSASAGERAPALEARATQRS